MSLNIRSHLCFAPDIDARYAFSGKALIDGKEYATGFYLPDDFSAEDVQSAWSMICQSLEQKAKELHVA